VQLVVAALIAVAIACLGVAVLLGSEPGEESRQVQAGAALVFGGLAALVVLVVGLWSGSRVAWLLPVAAITAVVGAASVAEDVHWRWSRADFESLPATEEFGCDGGCKVGWWRVERIERSALLVEVWIERRGCYDGRALVRPVEGSMDPEAIRESLSVPSSPYVHVEPWRDAWHEVCITS
jgi:hypothetical protein